MNIDISHYHIARCQKYCLWLNMPSHYQFDFIDALIKYDIDILIRFFGIIDENRRSMGWDFPSELSTEYSFVEANLRALDSIQDWRERIHIVPGTVGNEFLMKLIDKLIETNTRWVHWSECVKPGLNRLLRWPFRFLYGRKIERYALGALAVSSMAKKEFLTWGISKQKIMLLPYAMYPLKPSVKKENSVEEFARNRFVFMFCGALSQRKGVDVLLKAFQMIAHQYPLSALVLVGPDQKDGYYKNLSRSLGISEDSLMITGAVKYDRVRNILPLCQVFVLPSRYDGWGMVIYEAGCLAKPIISTENCGASHHLIIEDINGYKIKAGDVSALFIAMQRYIDSPGLAKIHGHNSAVMATFFHANKNVERFLMAMETYINRTLAHANSSSS